MALHTGRVSVYRGLRTLSHKLTHDIMETKSSQRKNLHVYIYPHSTQYSYPGSQFFLECRSVEAKETQNSAHYSFISSWHLSEIAAEVYSSMHAIKNWTPTMVFYLYPDIASGAPKQSRFNSHVPESELSSSQSL